MKPLLSMAYKLMGRPRPRASKRRDGVAGPVSLDDVVAPSLSVEAAKVCGGGPALPTPTAAEAGMYVDARDGRR